MYRLHSQWNVSCVELGANCSSSSSSYILKRPCWICLCSCHVASLFQGSFVNYPEDEEEENANKETHEEEDISVDDDDDVDDDAGKVDEDVDIEGIEEDEKQEDKKVKDGVELMECENGDKRVENGEKSGENGEKQGEKRERWNPSWKGRYRCYGRWSGKCQFSEGWGRCSDNWWNGGQCSERGRLTDERKYSVNAGEIDRIEF